MRSSFFPFTAARAVALAGALLLAASLPTPALAVPVFDMHAEDFLPMADDLRKALNLNSNQQILWQHTETKTRNLLRERKARRDRLQAATQAGTQGANVELRDLTKAIDEETNAAAAEEKLLREWWLTVNDALNESQRRIVAQQVSEHLLRVQDSGGGPRAGGERKEEGGGERRGGRRGGGAGGVGVGVGAGGASINLPGGG
ncbi:hypothetical protein NHH73_02340 [Oxalobacteraceae bacterium OTU3CINTB1]|nr:hypothetical protein NHH73_02340 [Oxalobacteraceae bacterium OTU3CINTB1]